MTFGAGAFGAGPFGGGDTAIGNLGFELGTAGLAELWQTESATQIEGLLPDYSDGSAIEDFEDGWVPAYAFDFATANFSGPIEETFELGWDNTGYLFSSFGSEMLMLAPSVHPTLIESFERGWNNDDFRFAFARVDDPYVFELTGEGLWPFSFDNSLANSFVDGDLSAPSLYGLRALAVEDFSFVKTAKSFVGDAPADTITTTAHGLTAGQRVVFLAPTAGALPAPLVAGAVYYVVTPTTNDFQVSYTSGGAAINLTTGGSGILQWTAPYEYWISMMVTV